MIEVHYPKAESYSMELIAIETFGNEAYFTHYDTENGQPVNPKIIDPADVIARLNREHCMKVSDSRVLLHTSELLVWHFTPPAHTPLYLKWGGFSGALKIKWPNLIFARKGGELYVAVVQHKTRPTDSTRLYYAPLPNVSANHQICLGSVNLPDNDDIDEISTTYLDSVKTHLNNQCFLRGQTTTNPKYLRWIKDKAKKLSPIRVSELRQAGTVGTFIERLAKGGN